MTSTKPVALVTGASSGIGKATAEALLQAGYTVYGTSRRAADTAPGSLPMLALDVTREASVAEAVSELMQREGRIDLLVNNAGVGLSPAGAEESSVLQAQALFDINFFGMVRMIRAVVPHMRQQGSGRIINIGSILGLVPVPYVALYVASKHAVAGYSEALDHELRNRGIRVSVIEPAYIRTPFEANNLMADALLTEYAGERETVSLAVGQAMASADAPSVVAAVVLKAARAARPQRRYTAGKAAARLRLLRHFAPGSVLDAGIRKNLKLA